MPNALDLIFDDGEHLRRAVAQVRGGRFEAALPEVYIASPPILRDRLGPHIHVEPDGQRILALSPNRRPAVEPSPLMVLEGWLPARPSP